MSNQTVHSNAKPEFDAYSNSYSETVNHALAFSGFKVDFFTRVKAEYLLDIINALPSLQHARDVLDVGCGVGNFHGLLDRHLRQFAGVDVSSACIDVARKRNPGIDYREFDGEHIPHQSESFDVAFAINVFHHVPIATRLPLTMDIRRVLRPGGVFIIFEHNLLNPLTMRVVNSCEFDADAILLPKSETEGLMARAGLDNVQTRFILTIPAAGAPLRAVDRLFSRLPLGAQYYTVGHMPKLTSSN